MYGSPVLRFEGFNVARFNKVSDDAYSMMSREVTVYQDLQGNIIDCWDTGKIDGPGDEQVRVLHVQNDPVNFTLYGADFTELANHVAFRMEMLLAYESPLPVDEYPENSASNTYQSTELFNFYTTKQDLMSEADSVPVHLSWTRVGQYLPWMKMGQTPGKLVYHAQGFKVMEGWEGIPEHLQTWVEENASDFQRPPVVSGFSDNMTSWRFFDEQVTAGAYESTCG